jgi:diacylglycerol kinase (ATP)
LNAPVWVIANPTAGRGTGARVLPDLRIALSSRTEIVSRETTAPGDEQNIAGQALDAGAQLIVSVGGDGTCTKVASVILHRRSTCALAVFPAGTGNDFAKTLGVQRSSLPKFASLLDQIPHKIDVGRADGHYFLNSCGFGFDAAVLDASTKVRRLTGNAIYIYAALKQLFTYGGVDVAVGNKELSRMLMVTVSNGQWLGGAFHIAPSASAIDGKLDVAMIRDSGVVERALLFLSATRGTHVTRSSVMQMQLPKVTLNFSSPPAMEIDGELRYAKSSTVIVECIPRALSVIAAPGALDSGRTTAAVGY